MFVVRVLTRMYFPFSRYVMAYGTEVDLHTAHWHGLTVTSDGHRVDTVELMPSTFRTVEMVRPVSRDLLFGPFFDVDMCYCFAFCTSKMEGYIMLCVLSFL